jgi:geranylgeranyl pyrophosphate synthase
MRALAEKTSSSHARGESLLGMVEERMAELVGRGRGDAAGSIKGFPNSTQAATYHLSTGGQRVRARLALVAGAALGLPPGDSVALASCVELIHNASLIHDDLQDRELYRRGAETVGTAYGSHVALCTGDLLLSASYAALAQFSDASLLPELFSLVHSRISQVIGGQCAQLVTTGDEERDLLAYESIATAKSGALLSLPLELALTGSHKGMWSADARRATEHFAIGYQIADDLEDVEQDRGSLSVNALIVLAEALHCDEQEAALRARKHALAHLAKSMTLAGSLPNGSGVLLLELAQALSDSLQGTH